MAVINADTRDAWQEIANEASRERPCPGRTVKIIGGRKHAGKVGRVIRHVVDRYSGAFRYGGDANFHLREMRGRYGFRCQVETETGERFWIKAEHTEVQP